MEFLTFNAMCRLADSYQYSPRLVKKCIILANKCSNERLATNSKLELFKMLSEVVVKNIQNFYSLTQSYENVIHTKDDLVGDAYFVMNKCLSNFDAKRGKQFYFYYNKSLTRAFVRIIEQNYLKHRNTTRVDEEFESFVFIGEVKNTLDLVEFYLDLFKLTEEEREIVRSKLADQKPRDFLLESDNVTWKTYFSSLESIKKKFEPLRTEK